MGEEVPSPTFTLVQAYEPAGQRLAFRFLSSGGPEEAWELGIEEAFADGDRLIEWPERLGDSLPPDRTEVCGACPRRSRRAWPGLGAERGVSRGW